MANDVDTLQLLPMDEEFEESTDCPSSCSWSCSWSCSRTNVQADEHRWSVPCRTGADQLAVCTPAPAAEDVTRGATYPRRDTDHGRRGGSG
ncbi:hypothetical protein [Streptomyces sp. NPDC037389]|uniref:hypothetical protein n=1 Tax=Streptomyces sp. NPDC037389 TaxID=3155369 RepID=UPI0033E118AC